MIIAILKCLSGYPTIVIINPQCTCAARVTVVESMCVCVCMCVSVCLSIKPHLTSGAPVRPEIDVTYSTGNEGQKFVGISCKDTPFPALYDYPCSPSENTHAHCISACFERGESSRSNTKGVCVSGLPKILPTNIASPCVYLF